MTTRPKHHRLFGSSDAQASRSQKGFTLVELLVVLAVLAVIGTLLLPAAAKAQSKMRVNRCMSNLQDIGTAMGLYMQDSQDKLPFASLRYNTGKKEHHYSWDDLMGAYLGVDLTMDQRSLDGATSGSSLKSLVCPLDAAPIKYASELPRTEHRRSYSMPEHNMGLNTIAGRKATAADWPPCPVNQTGIGLAYDGRINFANERWNPDDEPGAAKIPRWQSAFTLPMILEQSHTIFMTERFSGLNHVGSVAESVLSGINQHATAEAGNLPENLNYLMVDGHVENLAPTSTYSRTNASLTAPPSGMWTILAGD